MFQFDQLDQNGLKVIETGEQRRRQQHYALEKSRVGSCLEIYGQFSPLKMIV